MRAELQREDRPAARPSYAGPGGRIGARLWLWLAFAVAVVAVIALAYSM